MSHDTITLSKDEVESIIKDSTAQIKNEVKAGMKEAISEALNELQEDEVGGYLKQLVLVTSGLFFIYFIFILPGTSITPEELTQYNWFNQSLIEFKSNIINFFNKPTNPGNPPAPNLPDSPNNNNNC